MPCLHRQPISREPYQLVPDRPAQCKLTNTDARCSGCGSYEHVAERFCNEAGLLRLCCEVIRRAMASHQYRRATLWAIYGGMDSDTARTMVRRARELGVYQ